MSKQTDEVGRVRVLLNKVGQWSPKEREELCGLFGSILDRLEKAEEEDTAALIRVAKLEEALVQLKDYLDLGEVLFHASGRWKFAVNLVDNALRMGAQSGTQKGETKS